MNVLKDARLAEGFTQKDLAKIIGLTQPSIARLERGEQTITLENAQKLSKTLKVSIEEIIQSLPNGLVTMPDPNLPKEAMPIK